MVTPDWVLDSIDVGKVQDESLYHPTCLKFKSKHHSQNSRSSPSLQKHSGDDGDDGDGDADVGEQEGDTSEGKHDLPTTSGSLLLSALLCTRQSA